MTDRKQQWGGKREGAGRKPSGSPPMLRKNVTLPADVVARLEELGKGNLSAGIREAVRRLG